MVFGSHARPYAGVGYQWLYASEIDFIAGDLSFTMMRHEPWLTSPVLPRSLEV